MWAYCGSDVEAAAQLTSVRAAILGDPVELNRQTLVLQRLRDERGHGLDKILAHAMEEIHGHDIERLGEAACKSRC